VCRELMREPCRCGISIWHMGRRAGPARTSLVGSELRSGPAFLMCYASQPGARACVWRVRVAKPWVAARSNDSSPIKSGGVDLEG
jgi:hypothetical protein